MNSLLFFDQLRTTGADPILIERMEAMHTAINIVTEHMQKRHGITPQETADMVEREWNTTPQLAMIRMRYRLLHADRPPINIEVP